MNDGAKCNFDGIDQLMKNFLSHPVDQCTSSDLFWLLSKFLLQLRADIFSYMPHPQKWNIKRFGSCPLAVFQCNWYYSFGCVMVLSA